MASQGHNRNNRTRKNAPGLAAPLFKDDYFRVTWTLTFNTTATGDPVPFWPDRVAFVGTTRDAMHVIGRVLHRIISHTGWSTGPILDELPQATINFMKGTAGPFSAGNIEHVATLEVCWYHTLGIEHAALGDWVRPQQRWGAARR